MWKKFVVVFFAILWAFPAFAQETALTPPVEAEVLTEKAFVRADHENKSKRVATLEEADVVELLAEWKGGDKLPWYKVKIDGAEGWIYGQFVRRLDGGGVAVAPAASSKTELPPIGVEGSDEKYVRVVVKGEGTSRSAALEQAWIEAVRLAVGAVISSKTEIKDDKFAENIIAHSRGVVETFDILSENNDGKRTSIVIRAKVRKEILNDAANAYVQSQTVKASTQEAVKAQLDVKAEAATQENKQKSGAELLKEVLESYTPNMFYSATLDPKIEFDDKEKKSFLKITQKFNEDVFWKEFLPRLRTALDGIAVKKEKKFYNDAVRKANQDLAKNRHVEGGGVYSGVYRDKNFNDIYPNTIAPYSWHRDGEYGEKYPTGGFLQGYNKRDNVPFMVVVPENNSSYIVYYLDCMVNGDFYDPRGKFSNKNLAPIFDYLMKMEAQLLFEITYLDKNGEEIHTQIRRMGRRLLTTYRSYFFYEKERGAWWIREAVGFAPGYLGGTLEYLFLDSTKMPMAYYIELDNDDLQKVDSMKFEVIFQND